MSFGDFEYQETTSNQLARILKGMRQEQIILDAVQNPIDDVEEYPDARQVESVKGTKDHIGAVTIPVSKNWHYANEPNQDTRVWLWFREGWRLRDYSRHGNEAFAEQVEPSPVPVRNYVPLRRKQNDDGTTPGRLYGIIDGVSQYYRVLDSPENRLTDLLSTNNEFCFSCFFSPFESYTFDEADDRLRFIQKLDDDQSNNATRVELEEDGTVHFYLVYKGAAYHVETAPGVVPLVQVPEFQPGEFIDEEFMTQSPYAWQWNPNVAAPDWMWLFFSFDKTTRQLKIYKIQQNGMAAAAAAATELVTTTAAPDDQTILANVSMWLPANENDPTAIATYDITGNENHAIFDTDPTHAPTYTTDGFLHFTGDNRIARITNSPELNTFTNFTMAFKLRLHARPTGGAHDLVFSKGSTNATITTGGFMFFIHQAAPTNIHVDFIDNTGEYMFIEATGAIAALDTWYNVIFTYDGTTFRFEAGSFTGTPWVDAGKIFTNSSDLKLGSATHSFQGDIADVVFVKGEAWDTTKKNKYKARTPGFRTTDWPAYKPPPPPEPDTPLPVVRPVEKVYELLLPDTVTVKQLNNPATATPFVSIYNVPGGTPATTPETLKYDCPDGTSGGGSTSPVTTIYNLTAASSTGNIEWGSGERGYVQRINVAGSVFIGKNPTDMQFYVKNGGSASGGTAYCALFRNDGTYTKFGSGININSISTSSWVPITGTSFVTRTNMAMGDGVGVVWEGGSSGTLNVQRGGQNVHYDKDGSNNPRSWQDHLETGSVYGSDNDEFSIAGVVKDGGITTAGANPYAKLTLSQYVLGISQTNSTCEGILPTRVIWRVRRVGSAASATLKCYIINSSGTVLKTIGSAISFNSISTTLQDLEFIDRDNAVAWADTYMVALAFDVKTGINNTTVYLEVNYNIGTGSGQVEGTAIKARMYNGTSAYVDVSPVCDWAGKIYVGGSSFTAYKQFTPTSWTIAEKVNSSTSPVSKLYGQKFSKLKATMKKVGSPTGPIRAKVWDNSGAEKANFPVPIDASSLSTSVDTDYVFTFPTNAYVSTLNDRIGLEYFGATSTDYVLVKINTDAAAGAAGDTTKSILSAWVSGTGWVDEQTLDMAFEIFTGGVPDLVSRSKAAIRCDSIFSILNRRKVTRAVIPLKKVGAPTGNYFIRSVRGSDGSNRDLLGSGDISLLSTSTWTYKDVSNYNATFFIGESDKIVVEYEGGDSSNGLIVQVQQDSTYDDADTRYEDFDSVNWNTTGYDTWDMGATLYVGGDTYIPDAGTPYVPPPDFYDHDWLIGSGAFVKGGPHTSFYGMRIRDFKVETSIPSLEDIDTLFDNKYSRRGGKGEVALIGYTTYNSETEPPV